MSLGIYFLNMLVQIIVIVFYFNQFLKPRKSFLTRVAMYFLPFILITIISYLGGDKDFDSNFNHISRYTLLIVVVYLSYSDSALKKIVMDILFIFTELTCKKFTLIFFYKIFGNLSAAEREYTSIGDSAFSYCENLTSVTVLNPECEIYDYESTICNSYDYKYSGVIKGYSGSTAEAYAKSTTTSTTTTVQITPDAVFGDIDGDRKITANDASNILMFYAYLSGNGTETDIKVWRDNLNS